MTTFTRKRFNTEGVLQMPGSISDIQGDIFYIEARAPYEMSLSHVHGHVELNYLMGCSATYLVNGRQEHIPENRLALFWANIPHQMVKVHGEGELFNLYIPLPQFLQWPLANPLRKDILAGNIVLAKYDHQQIFTRLQRWYEDYKTESTELREIILGELALLLKRVGITGWDHPDGSPLSGEGSHSPRKGAQHVSTMIRFIAENLHRPISTSDVASHIGLHKNYTTNLFSSVMGMTIKQYLQFQRLQRAQLLLVDNERQVSDVGYDCGFSSLSRFYEAFQRYYGMPPGQFRKRFLQDK
ncbi:hypothetical protein ACH42_10920 [Endozoicomonas sp. (ex Bugula neritina AB1)]|nr:hypothetical protein ACH42_10920 [Endozoicomonas sp. (ex Bugula neritina AB1)]